MRSRSTSGRCWRKAIAACRSRVPPQPHEFGSPSLSTLAAAIEEEHAVAVADSIRVCRCEPLRPRKANTAAPLRDGT